MKFLKFFGLWIASCGLVVLVACNNQAPSTSTSQNTSAASTAPTEQATHADMGHSKRININAAILSELDKLEAKLGVPALSNKIQASRPYGKVEELVSKNVITQAQFDQIKDMVTIEDIQLTGEAKDVDYMVKLSLMKGHMMVAKELLDLGKPDQAEPHIGHPVEEIYADVEDQLNERNVKAFKNELIALQDRVKAGAKDANKTAEEYKASMQSIDGAIAALPETQHKDHDFVLQVINGLLDTANSEYTSAIADGKVKEAIEYQDSRGFVMYADELYKGIANQIQKEYPDSHKKIIAMMADLLKVWPTAIPPQQSVKTPEEVGTLIKQIETETKKAS
ncbi:helix-hairpin-helix domain-containing protein [Alkalinema sp. FACHB-956]|uniref:helix-hairpin-helix domain-containing protein n=1 Tax=Alkalinema sp. FACHB-956 TaxID=2692768 RepID=UPI0016834443|nr:helix-hairpin-helix domain-containing protein [Alkalinema sp. FACHB-956]MBD2326168.1 helix-hairpin-helix domain-containing protein [Alkalinema sp. FACHB-956]